jgi:hypothetical protein
MLFVRARRLLGIAYDFSLAIFAIRSDVIRRQLFPCSVRVIPIKWTHDRSASKEGASRLVLMPPTR